MINKAPKSKIPYFFFAFFAVILAVNIAYIYVAGKSWRGVVVDKAYQRGVEYNQTIALDKKQREMGWKVEMKFDNLGNQNGVLRVLVLDKNSKLIDDANIRLYLKRPTQDGFDFELPLIFVDGKYQAKISFPLKGQWDFSLEISRDYDVFYEVKRFIIQ
jgi:nitrogen fixation protein FixH